MTKSAPDARDALAQMSVTSPSHTATVHNNTNGANTSAVPPDAVTLNTPEFEAFVADVAARIIQTYWRKTLARKAATAASEPQTGPRSAPPMPHCGPEPSSLPPFETAGLEGGHCQPVATSERELSTNSLENIEALMNRYRKDEPSVGAAKRSNQDAMHHAVSILRAAGMPVDGCPQTQRGVVSDCEGQGPTGAELSCTISHTVKSANKSNSVECTRRSNAADTILETTSTSAERPSAAGHPARRWNVRERISGLRAGSIDASHLERNEEHVQCTHGQCENSQASFNTLPQASFNTSADHSGVDVGMEQEHAAADHCGVKLNSILEYLDTVSQQADEEAALVVGTGRSHMSACNSSRRHRPPSEFLVTHPNMRTPDPVSLPRTLEAALAEHVEANLASKSSNGKCAQGENVATGSFCEEVRSRMQKLQQEMQGREKNIASLNVQIQALQSAHSEQIKAMKVSHDAELSAQKKESEAALKRHLDLIDRLLADKDALSHRLDDAKDQLGSLEARHDDTVAAMKAGWALELRRQKDGWAAAEKSKREGWLADKTKEIKDATIKGLEPEIQSLVQKHRKEMAELKEFFQNDNKRQMDSLREQHETHVRQLRERMLHDREVAVEGERSAAQKRLSDAAERYEASAQQARMHLVADHDRRLGEAEDAWRMHRRELQDKVKQLEQLCHDLQDGKSAAVREALDEERQKNNKAVKVIVCALHETVHTSCGTAIVRVHLKAGGKAVKIDSPTFRPLEMSMMLKIKHGGELLQKRPASSWLTKRASCAQCWVLSVINRLSW
eukprot:jgi/Ulvmu1/4832/UM020_0118.1